MPKIAIVDYALGNLFNIQRAFQSIGIDTFITDKKEDITNADKIVLPGVGAFGEGMRHLKGKGLIDPIKEAASRGKPLLGICLGMQLLMSESEEHGRWEGLDLIPGKVVRFDPPDTEDKFKIPQIGWNGLLLSGYQKPKGPGYWKDTVLEGLEEGSSMYFVHSYHVQVEKPEHSIADTEYGRNRFCSVLQKDNIVGCQFHPERSAAKGVGILKKFATL